MAGSGASDDEVIFEMAQFIRVYKSGRVERFFGSDPVPLVHPYFLGADRVASEETDPALVENVVTMWRVVCPGTSGVDDPWINPLVAGAPGLEGLACARVLVCLAEKDVCRDRGRAYAEELRASGWPGEVEVLEVNGQGHCFHLVDFACADAVAQDDAIARFVNL